MKKTIHSFLCSSALASILCTSARADYSDFNSLCQAQLKSPTGVATCEKIHSLFFTVGEVKEFAPYTPAQVGAPALSIDPKVMFLTLNDPNYMSGMAYCYFVFRKWVKPAEMSPDAFGSGVTGFAVLNEQLHEYQEWLANNAAGKSCKKLVEKEAGIPVANLEVSMRGHAAIIVMNPYALIREKGADSAAVFKEMALTTNHERIHAYQVLCPGFEKRSQEMWAALSPPVKEQVKAKHPGYPWQDPKVAAREFVAFELEKTPEKLASLIGNCKF